MTNESLQREVMEKARITYRGWPGHFCCGYRCEFHLNTLIELGDTKIVVSTVGRLREVSETGKYVPLGPDRHFETMAFHARKGGEFWDADVSRQVFFDSRWAWPSVHDEWEATKGHCAVVEEIAKKMEDGTIDNRHLEEEVAG